MWGRTSEITLALWLLMSPFLFSHVGTPLAINDWACGAAVLVLSCLSFWPPLRRAHLVNLGISVWLAGWAYASYPHPAPAGAQNEILVGLTLLLLAMIPNDNEKIPIAWRRHFEAKARRKAGVDV